MKTKLELALKSNQLDLQKMETGLLNPADISEKKKIIRDLKIKIKSLDFNDPNPFL